MVQILLVLDGAIQLIGVDLGMVWFVPVLQEVTFLLQPAHGQVELNALVPGYSIVLITKHDQQWCFDPVGKKDRGVFNVQVPGFPQASSDATLGFFILKLSILTVYFFRPALYALLKFDGDR